MKNNKLKNGFTLLLSVLVTSIILSVGLGIFNIMTKELKLSGLGRESQIAFYAADAGIECFFFWEIKQSAFEPDGSANTISCAGNSIVLTDTDASGNSLYDFTIPFGISSDPCVKVEVSKDYSATNKIITTVKSKGYNTVCDSTSPFKVERAIQLVSTKQEGGAVSASPDAPSNVQAQAVSESQINLSWDAALNATSYLIYRGVDANNLSEIGNTTATSYSDTGLTDNTTYYYKIVASNDYGYTAESAVASATTKDASQSCAADGGSWNSFQLVCYFSGTSCKTGWAPNQSYSTTLASSCSNSWQDCNSQDCTTASHTRLNAGIESCVYVPGGVGCYTSVCYATQTEIGCKKN